MPVLQPIGSLSMQRAVTLPIRSLFPSWQRRKMTEPVVPNWIIIGFKSIIYDKYYKAAVGSHT